MPTYIELCAALAFPAAADMLLQANEQEALAPEIAHALGVLREILLRDIPLLLPALAYYRRDR
jgi:hypothetical protein